MKKNIQTLLATLLIAITISFPSKASHFMGGEITWKCISGGQYIFQMKVYRNCNGIPFGPPVTLDVHNNPALTTIPLNLISQTDISGFTTCDSCSGAMGTTPGVVEELIFESNPISLTGIPPVQGWVFSYSSCCRSSGIVNIPNAASTGFCLRAIMYSVNGQSANPCYDSSPYFAEEPATTIGTSYNFHYTPFAIDPDLDSLVYAWASPLDSWVSGPWSSTNPPQINYLSGYNPLPSSVINPLNINVTLDSSTGETTYKGYSQGVFNYVYKVTSYKCGVICSEIFREMEFHIVPTITNSAPSISPPFIDPNTSLPTFYDTVYAGDYVNFSITALDTGFQNITIEAAGSEFGAGFTDSVAGCLIPPCAILNPPPPLSSPVIVSTNFQWQTTNDHLGLNYYGAYMTNTHYFLIQAKDDICPVHAFNVAVIAITVLPVLPKPVIMQSNDTLYTASLVGFNYQWYKNRFVIPGSTANSYKFTTAGDYQVRLIEISGHSGNYSDFFHPVATGVNSTDNNSSSITVSPNPSKGKFVLSDFNLNNFEITVTDRIGKTVYQESFSNYNSNTLSIELKNADDGIYFVQLKSETKSYQTRIMIRK